ncbi:hypothetical protein llg_13800 [Luteolibacter sp. LG18]|nr:hypothetical protein llg_13800 [Luteolibacter sp. LG18]
MDDMMGGWRVLGFRFKGETSLPRPSQAADLVSKRQSGPFFAPAGAPDGSRWRRSLGDDPTGHAADMEWHPGRDAGDLRSR